MDGLLGVDLSFSGDFDDDGIFENDLTDNLTEEGFESGPLNFDRTEETEELVESDFDSEDFEDFDLEDDSISDEDDEGVSLETIDFRKEINEKAWEGVEYPSLLIDGLTTEEELSFFRGRNSESKNSLPLYCVVEGTPVKVCQLEISLQTFLNFKIIGGYTIQLCRDSSNSTVIPLDKPEALVKFIKL